MCRRWLQKRDVEERLLIVLILMYIYSTRREASMMLHSAEELDSWQFPQPTSEELRLSGGLLVEDWPHARQVRRLSLQLFDATQPLHHLKAGARRLLERAAFLHNTGMMIETRRHHKHS